MLHHFNLVRNRYQDGTRYLKDLLEKTHLKDVGVRKQGFTGAFTHGYKLSTCGRNKGRMIV
jgi:hypothetical protein